MKNIRTIVIDQLYNLVAGILYAVSICYFAKNADFAPGGLSGLALIGNYLWGLPIGTTTLVLNIPLILLSLKFLGKTFLAKTLITMLWCTFFQDVVFTRIPGYTGDPLLAAIFAGITLGGSLALMYMRGTSSGGTDFLTMSIKMLRPHLSVGALTGLIDLVIILLGWPVFGSVDAVLYGLITTVGTSLVIDKIMYGSSSSKMLTIITTKGQEIADAPLRLCPAPGLHHPHRRLPHRPQLHGHELRHQRGLRRGLHRSRKAHRLPVTAAAFVIFHMGSRAGPSGPAFLQKKRTGTVSGFQIFTTYRLFLP